MKRVLSLLFSLPILCLSAMTQAQGPGRAGSVPIWTGTNTQGNSQVTDDGSIVIVPNLVDKGGQVFNVKAYGALGNGTADDTAAINSAIIAAAAAGGGRVYFPATTASYLVYSSLIITNPNITLEGTNRMSSRIKATGVFSPLIVGSTSTAATYFSLKNLWLDGNSMATAGLTIVNATHGAIENVRVSDFTGDGVLLAGNAVATYYWSLRDNNIVNNGGFGIKDAGESAYAWNLSSNQIAFNSGGGVYWSSSGLDIGGGSIESNGGVGFSAGLQGEPKYIGGIKLHGVYFENNGSAGGVSENIHLGRAGSEVVGGVAITGCYINGPGDINAGGQSNTQTGINVESAQGVEISGNDIQGQSTQALLLNPGLLPHSVHVGNNTYPAEPATGYARFRGLTDGSVDVDEFHNTGTATWAPVVDTGRYVTTNIAVGGAKIGDTVAVGFSNAVPGGAILAGSVASKGNVVVTLLNQTGKRLSLGSGVVRADIWHH